MSVMHTGIRSLVMEQINLDSETDLRRLQGFIFERILLDEPEQCRLTVLGTFPPTFLSTSTQESGAALPAIIRLEKTAIPSHVSRHIFPDSVNGYLSQIKCMENTDIYMWLAGWLSPSSMEKLPQGDVKVNIVCPATEVHIQKYSPQNSVLVRETPEIYRSIVQPFITSFPPERTRWVRQILDGHKEQAKFLFSSPDFILLPDMKWDLHTISSLYLIAIVRDHEIRSLRDLRTRHIPLLKSIRREAFTIVRDKWDIEAGGLRMYIHYQPSYYHFHVHIVNANYEAGLGMRIGQAHLLDDVISLLELDEGNPSESPQIFEKMTLTYGLGEQHGLYTAMRAAAQAEV